MRQDRCSGTTLLFQLLFRQSHQAVQELGAVERAALHAGDARSPQRRRRSELVEPYCTRDATRGRDTREEFNHDLACRILA
jgi:hypothetical protein